MSLLKRNVASTPVQQARRNLGPDSQTCVCGKRKESATFFRFGCSALISTNRQMQGLAVSYRI